MRMGNSNEGVVPKLPSYEDSNASPILEIQLTEPQKKYGENDVMTGNISFMFSSGLNNFFAARSYSQCYVILELKCAFMPHKNFLRSYAKPYACHRTIGLKIEGPFPNSAMSYGRYMIPFTKSLKTITKSLPPTMPLVNFKGYNGGTKWELSSWIEGVDQSNEIEAMHWTEHRKEVNVYTIPGLQQEAYALPLTRSVCTTPPYELTVSPLRIPQKPETFTFEFTLNPLFPLHLETVEVSFKTQLWVVVSNVRCNLIHCQKLCCARPQTPVYEKFVQRVTNCALAVEWPERFSRVSQMLRHLLIVDVQTEEGTKKEQHIFDVDVMPPSWVRRGPVIGERELSNEPVTTGMQLHSESRHYLDK